MANDTQEAQEAHEVPANPVRQMAVATLGALAAVPGALHIITNIPSERQRRWRHGGAHPDSPLASPRFRNNPLGDHRMWVIHPVERIDGPNHRGQYTAYSVEYDAADYGFPARRTRDECTGQPEALLSRLTEVSRSQAAYPEEWAEELESE